VGRCAPLGVPRWWDGVEASESDSIEATRRGRLPPSTTQSCPRVGDRLICCRSFLSDRRGPKEVSSGTESGEESVTLTRDEGDAGVMPRRAHEAGVVRADLGENRELEALDAGCGRMWSGDLEDLSSRLTGVDEDADALRLRVEEQGDPDGRDRRRPSHRGAARTAPRPGAQRECARACGRSGAVAGADVGGLVSGGPHGAQGPGSRLRLRTSLARPRTGCTSSTSAGFGARSSRALLVTVPSGSSTTTCCRCRCTCAGPRSMGWRWPGSSEGTPTSSSSAGLRQRWTWSSGVSQRCPRVASRRVRQRCAGAWQALRLRAVPCGSS
jgi:hypothetical protein